MDPPTTPKNVTKHPYLEGLTIALVIFMSLFSGLLTAILMLFLLIFGHWILKIICLLYIAFICFDRRFNVGGLRSNGSKWLKGLSCWKHVFNYYPIDMVKTAELPPDKNYLICFFPHGIFCHGVVFNFLSSYSKWWTLFPGIRTKVMTLRRSFMGPLFREFLYLLGMCAASPESLIKTLTQTNDPSEAVNSDGFTANAAVLVVGGAQEPFLTLPNRYRLFLKNRKGFIRIALKTGAPLVPVISFGENDVVKFLKGRWFSLIPQRRPITAVVGAPIYLTKNPDPSQEEINEIHELFCRELTELFEAHKHKYVKDFENNFLELV